MKTATLAEVFPVRSGGYWGADPGTGDADARAIRNGDVGTSGNLSWRALPLRAYRSRELAKAQVHAGDIVLTTSGNCGNVAFVGAEPAESTVATNFVRVLRVDRATVDARYAFYFLRTSTFMRGIAPFVRGATIKNLSVEDAFSCIRLPVPPLPEQRRIAAILDHADALRAKRRQVLAHLDTLTQSIFHDLFGHPLRGDRWPVRRLGDLARIVRGASPRPAGDPRYFGGSIPWLKISDLTAQPGPYVRSIKESVTEAGRAKSVLLPPGTLVLSNSATVGISKIIEPSTCIHDGFLAFLDLADDIDKTWLWASLSAARSEFVAMAPEGTQKNLNGPIVKAVKIGIPPIARQRRFVAFLESVSAWRTGVQRALSVNDQLFDSLQSRAFRGEL